MVMKGEAGPPGPTFQSLEQQFAQQRRGFQKRRGSIAPDGSGGFGTYRGTNPNGVAASMRILVPAQGWILIGQAPEASDSSLQQLVFQIGESFRAVGDPFFSGPANNPPAAARASAKSFIHLLRSGVCAFQHDRRGRSSPPEVGEPDG
jgi:hypothetical protein